jgi:hypothetical protein
MHTIFELGSDQDLPNQPDLDGRVVDQENVER